LKLRNAFYDPFPWKDIKEAWKVDIVVSAKEISVVHSSKACAHNPNPEQYFEFDWQLSLLFNRYMTKMDAKTEITDWRWNEKTAKDLKRVIEKAFSPFAPTHVPFTRHWKRSLVKSGVHVYLPRLALSTEIVYKKKTVRTKVHQQRLLLTFFFSCIKEILMKKH